MPPQTIFTDGSRARAAAAISSADASIVPVIEVEDPGPATRVHPDTGLGFAVRWVRIAAPVDDGNLVIHLSQGVGKLVDKDVLPAGHEDLVRANSDLPLDDTGVGAAEPDVPTSDDASDQGEDQ